jgi:hypothetical protein
MFRTMENNSDEVWLKKRKMHSFHQLEIKAIGSYRSLEFLYSKFLKPYFVNPIRQEWKSVREACDTPSLEPVNSPSTSK